MSKGFYYFAHPYTVKDNAGNYVHEAEEANFRLCCYRASRLLLRGYNIYAPIAHAHPIHCASPIFLQWHEHKLWYTLDEEFIRRCDFDGIILAPDWRHSVGCTGELQLFNELGKDVFYYKDIVE